MYYDDHAPPHFHAYFGDDVAVIAIDTLEVIEGGLPKRPLALVVEWAQQHRDELREGWRLAELHQALKPIPALV